MLSWGYTARLCLKKNKEEKQCLLSLKGYHSSTLNFLCFLSAEDQSQDLSHARQALTTEINSLLMVLGLTLQIFLEMLPLVSGRRARPSSTLPLQASRGVGVANGAHSGLSRQHLTASPLPTPRRITWAPHFASANGQIMNINWKSMLCKINPASGNPISI